MAKKTATPAIAPAVAAPDPPLGVIQPVALDRIQIKPQFRKHFDETRLAELADSIRRHGVLQPVLLRPLGGVPATGYQLVAGERRYRAATAAGLKEIPANVRQMTDLEVLEIQVTENLQREDLHPLEEAEGFKALLAESNRNLSPAEPRLTVEGLATKIHRGRDYVYKRLRLADLPESAKAAFWEGKINLQIALLVARMSNPEIQEKAVAHLIDEAYDDEPIRYSDAVDELRRKFMLLLGNAPFDTACDKLCADAGPCTICPKRTVNSPDLFGDITKADMCTDEVCYKRKLDAHWRKTAEAAKFRGQKVLSDKESEKIFPWHGRVGGGYEIATERRWVDGESVPVAKLIEKLPEPQRPRITLARNPHDGSTVELVNKAEADKALKAAGILQTASPSTTRDDAALRAESKRRKSFDDAAMDRIVDLAQRQSIPQVNPLEFWRMLTALVVFGCNVLSLQRVCKRRGWEGIKAEWSIDWKQTVRTEAEKLTADRLCGLIVELLVFEQQIHCEGTYSNTPHSEAMLLAAKLYGIDLEALKKELATAAEDAKAAKKAGKKPAAAPAQPAAGHSCPVCSTEYETWQQAQECKEDCLAKSQSEADTVSKERPAETPSDPTVERGLFDPEETTQIGTTFRLASKDNFAAIAGQTLELKSGLYQTKLACRIGPIIIACDCSARFESQERPTATEAYADALRQAEKWFSDKVQDEWEDEAEALDDILTILGARLVELDRARKPAPPAPAAAPASSARKKRFPYPCGICGEGYQSQGNAEKCELRCAAVPETKELAFEEQIGRVTARAVVRAVRLGEGSQVEWGAFSDVDVVGCKGYRSARDGDGRHSSARAALVTGLERIGAWVIAEHKAAQSVEVKSVLKLLENGVREWIDRLNGFGPSEDSPATPPPASSGKKSRKKKELAHV